MNDDQDQAGAAPVDDLAALAVEAGQLEAGATPAGVPGQVAPAAPNVAEEARAVMGVMLAVALPVLAAVKPTYADCYGPAQQKAIADSFAVLAESQGWQMGEAMGRYGPWIGFAAAVAGPVLPVVLADLKKQRDEAASGIAGPVKAAPEMPAAPPPGDHHLAGQRVMPDAEGQRVL